MPLPLYEAGTRYGVPQVARCTIARPGAPGYPIQNPWTGRMGEKGILPSIRDVYGTQTVKALVTIPLPSLQYPNLGYADKAFDRMAAILLGFDLAGVPISEASLYTLVAYMEFSLMVDFRTIFSCQGLPARGIQYPVEIASGSSLQLQVVNSNPASLLNGQTILFQLFLSGLPQYAIEMTRKGNPST